MMQHVAVDQYAEQQTIIQRVMRAMASRASLSDVIALVVDGACDGLKADGARLVLDLDGSVSARSAGQVASLMAAHDHGVLSTAGAGDGCVPIPGEMIPAFNAGWGAAVVAHGLERGALWVAFTVRRTLSDADAGFLSLLASQAGLAVAHALALRAARREQQWVEVALATATDPVLVMDREWRLQVANQAARSAIPALRDTRAGQRIDELLVEGVGLLNEYGRPAAEFTGEDGRVYAPGITPVQPGGGEPAGWVLALRDISQFKQLNASMAEFISTVSHDMRSPLTFVKGYVDMLDMVGDLNEKQAGFVEKTLEGVVQMADMVEKILKAGKLDPTTGTYQLEREPTDLAHLAEKVAAALNEPALKKGLTLDLEVDPDIPLLHVDPSLFESAFMNLAENAVKYTPENGRVKLALALYEDALVFGVSDDGYGISTEHQQQLFQRNVRIRRKEWKRVKGSGLGLFIVKNVAQRHGGDAWVESVEGEGSTFYLSIPLDETTLVATHAATS